MKAAHPISRTLIQVNRIAVFVLKLRNVLIQMIDLLTNRVDNVLLLGDFAFGGADHVLRLIHHELVLRGRLLDGAQLVEDLLDVDLSHLKRTAYSVTLLYFDLLLP